MSGFETSDFCLRLTAIDLLDSCLFVPGATWATDHFPSSSSVLYYHLLPSTTSIFLQLYLKPAVRIMFLQISYLCGLWSSFLLCGFAVTVITRARTYTKVNKTLVM